MPDIDFDMRPWDDFNNIVMDAIKRHEGVHILDSEVKAVFTVISVVAQHLNVLGMLGYIDPNIWPIEQQAGIYNAIDKLANSFIAGTDCDYTYEDCQNYINFTTGASYTIMPFLLANPRTAPLLIAELEKNGINVDDLYEEE